jgi:hypothetical protein
MQEKQGAVRPGRARKPAGRTTGLQVGSVIRASEALEAEEHIAAVAAEIVA